MNLVDRETARTKKAADSLILAIVPIMLIGSVIMGMMLGEASLLEMYGWNALVVEAVILLLPALIFMLRGGGFERFGFRSISPKLFLLSLLLGVGLFFIATAINSIAGAIFYSVGLPPSGTQMPQESSVIMPLVYLALAPAIAEEALFRGALLRSWLPVNAKKAVFHVSMLFALVHFQLTATPALFAVGFMLTYMSWLTKSVYTSMAMHFSYNGTAVILSSLLSGVADGITPDAFDAFDQLSQLSESGLMMFIGVVVAALLYIGAGFLIGHPSYRAILRDLASKSGINSYDYRYIRERLEAELIETPISSVSSDEPTAEPAPSRIMSWRVAVAYALMLLIGIGVMITEMML